MRVIIWMRATYNNVVTAAKISEIVRTIPWQPTDNMLNYIESYLSHCTSFADSYHCKMRPLTEEETKIFFEKLNK